MKYYVQRQLNEYGPYSLADLQRYVAQGNVLLTDLTRSEGMTDWVPVSQVIGNIPVPVPAAPMQAPGGGYSGGTVYGAASAPALVPEMFSNPPNFHWVGVLLLGLFTRWLFADIWLIVQAMWLRKVTNSTKDIFLAAGALASLFFGVAMIAVNDGADDNPALIVGFLLAVGSIVLRIVAQFSMRSSIEDHYNTVEPMNLSLSGVMTFFFGTVYFQYHFNQINSWKRASALGLGN
jgi:GYF domain 2